MHTSNQGLLHMLAHLCIVNWHCGLRCCCTMLSATIEMASLLQLKSYARAYQLPHSVHLLLNGVQSGLMLEVH